MLQFFILPFMFSCHAFEALDEDINELQVEVIGSTNLDTDRIINLIKEKDLAQLGKKDLLNVIIKDLYKTGSYSNISVSMMDKLIVVTVKENPLIRNVEFSFNHSPLLMDNLNAITDSLRKIVFSYFKMNELYSEYKLYAFIKQINAELKYALSPNTCMYVSVEPSLLKEGVIIDLSLEYNQNVWIDSFTTAEEDEEGAEILSESLNTGDPNSFWLLYKNKYAGASFSEKVQAFEQSYKRRGYFDFKLLSVSEEISDDSTQANVKIEFIKNNKYKIKKAVVFCNKKLDATLTNQAEIESLVNSDYSSSKIQECEKFLRESFQNDNFPCSLVTSKIVVDREEKSVTVVFFITTKKQSPTISEINIYSDQYSLILNSLDIALGDVYDHEKVQRSKKLLENKKFADFRFSIQELEDESISLEIISYNFTFSLPSVGLSLDPENNGSRWKVLGIPLPTIYDSWSLNNFKFNNIFNTGIDVAFSIEFKDLLVDVDIVLKDIFKILNLDFIFNVKGSLSFLQSAIDSIMLDLVTNPQDYIKKILNDMNTGQAFTFKSLENSAIFATYLENFTAESVNNVTPLLKNEKFSKEEFLSSERRQSFYRNMNKEQVYVLDPSLTEQGVKILENLKTLVFPGNVYNKNFFNLTSLLSYRINNNLSVTGGVVRSTNLPYCPAFINSLALSPTLSRDLEVFSKFYRDEKINIFAQNSIVAGFNCNVIATGTRVLNINVNLLKNMLRNITNLNGKVVFKNAFNEKISMYLEINASVVLESFSDNFKYEDWISASLRRKEAKIRGLDYSGAINKSRINEKGQRIVFNYDTTNTVFGVFEIIYALPVKNSLKFLELLSPKALFFIDYIFSDTDFFEKNPDFLSTKNSRYNFSQTISKCSITAGFMLELSIPLVGKVGISLNFPIFIDKENTEFNNITIGIR